MSGWTGLSEREHFEKRLQAKSAQVDRLTRALAKSDFLNRYSLGPARCLHCSEIASLHTDNCAYVEAIEYVKEQDR